MITGKLLAKYVVCCLYLWVPVDDVSSRQINKASVDDLQRRLDKRYPDGLENDFLTAENFRPNVVLDADTPYCEDEFLELRVGALLI